MAFEAEIRWEKVEEQHRREVLEKYSYSPYLEEVEGWPDSEAKDSYLRDLKQLGDYSFIVTMTCPHCKARETYSIDLWDRRRETARMKSFERGHTMNNVSVAEALAKWKS